MFCSTCGAKVLDGAEFCQNCGAKIVYEDTAQHQQTGAEKIEVTENTRIPSDNAAEEKKRWGSVANIGRVLMWGSLLLLAFNLPINHTILVIGVAIGIILSAVGAKRPWTISKIIELATAVLLLVVIVVMSFGNGSDKYVRMVKEGTLEGYPQKTVGEAFDSFLGDPKWESGLTDDKERFVNVKGDITYYGEEADLTVQFVVDEADGSFYYYACEINGTPQSDFAALGLFETVYGYDPASEQSDSQSVSETMSDKIMIGETQSYDNEFGNMEVTLDYAVFRDKIENEWTGEYIYPDKGNVFLWIAVTVQNIGTEPATLLSAWNTLVYDGSYEFADSDIAGDISDSIQPLSSPKEGALIFEVSEGVMESDKSLVLNVNNMNGSPVLSYAIRAGGDGMATSPNGSAAETASHQRDEGTSFPLSVSSDAVELFDQWAAEHPLLGSYHLDLISDDETDNDGNKVFLFTLETDNSGMFNMTIRKSDGYMEYLSKFESMSMDDWYTWFWETPSDHQ